MHDSRGPRIIIGMGIFFVKYWFNWKVIMVVAVTNMVSNFLLLRSHFCKFRNRSTQGFHLRFSESTSCCSGVCLRMNAWSLVMDSKTRIYPVGATCMVGVLACLRSFLVQFPTERRMLDPTRLSDATFPHHILYWPKKNEGGNTNSNIKKTCTELDLATLPALLIESLRHFFDASSFFFSKS